MAIGRRKEGGGRPVSVIVFEWFHCVFVHARASSKSVLRCNKGFFFFVTRFKQSNTFGLQKNTSQVVIGRGSVATELQVGEKKEKKNDCGIFPFFLTVGWVNTTLLVNCLRQSLLFCFFFQHLFFADFEILVRPQQFPFALSATL